MVIASSPPATANQKFAGNAEISLIGRVRPSRSPSIHRVD
jgi:hypothetical protein